MTRRAGAPADITQTTRGMYLTFVLGGQQYGIDILDVREIIGMRAITVVPRSPDFVRGVINLRGRVIPVMDLRKRFALPVAAETPRTCIIVLDVQGVAMGVTVDAVSEIQEFGPGDIEPAPTFDRELRGQFVEGIAHAAGEITILLHVARVVGTDAGSDEPAERLGVD